MRASVPLVVSLALSGCTVALHGAETSGGGATGATTSAAVRAQAGGGSARFGASFGAPAPPGAAGGHATFSRGASAVLVIGLVVAEAIHYLKGRPAADPAGAPQRAIADTCSCYGYRPPDTAIAPER